MKVNPYKGKMVADSQGTPGQEGEGGRCLCPFCGAEPAGLLDFGCGTGTPKLVLHEDYEPQWIRSHDCKDRQISQLKERLDAWREWYIANRINEPERLRAATKRLRELGET